MKGKSNKVTPNDRRNDKLPPLHLNNNIKSNTIPQPHIKSHSPHSFNPNSNQKVHITHQHQNRHQNQQIHSSSHRKLLNSNIGYRLGEKKFLDESNKTIVGPLFTYHGDESTAPPFDIAINYANNLPYRAGMPGPSFTWSAYGQSTKEAIKGLHELLYDVIQSQPQTFLEKISSINILGNFNTEMNELKNDEVTRIFPVITERLDESLIALSEFLHWSIADMVNVMTRKVIFFRYLDFFMKL